MLNQVGKVLGDLPFRAMLRLMGPAMKNALPRHRRAALVAEFRRNDPGFVRRPLPPYLAYLDRHGSVAPRLCDSGVPSWIVFGDNDDIGVTAAERGVLEACPTATLISIADAGHFTLNQRPDAIGRIVLDAASASNPLGS